VPKHYLASQYHVIDPSHVNELFAIARTEGATSTLIAGFAHEATSLLRALHHASTAGDRVAGRAALHRLKGAAGAIGAIELMNKLHCLEYASAIGAPQREELSKLVIKTCEALHRVRQQLQRPTAPTPEDA
jgi:HPt (histidine-containing phosphotransfer) domain-containing protein